MAVVPERSRSPKGPRHVAPGSELPPWWHALDNRRLRVAIGATLLALPLLVLDNLPERTRGTAEAVETVAPPTTEAPTTTPTTAATTTSTTAAPTTTSTIAPTTTEPPTTAPPVSRVVTPTTAPPTTAPPTTAPPTTAPPPPAGSIEAIIHAHFGAAGADAVTIARCESGLNPSAVGGSGATRYYGLFQLSTHHAAAFGQVTGRSFEEAWSDPNANAQYAAWLYGRSGWSPWGCRWEL